MVSRTIQILMTLGLSTGAAAVFTGCDTTTPKTQANTNGIRGDVTDVRPMEPAAQAAYQPPVYDNTAIVPTAPQALSADSVAMPIVSSAPTAGKTHVVRHGETFFSIAKASYGDGKQWKKIASANPTVSASKLKVGQVLVLP